MLGIIHIGTEKTGSKTIQDFIYRNAKLLGQHGVGTLGLSEEHDDRSLVTYAMRDRLVDEHVSALSIEDAASRKTWRKAFAKQCAASVAEISEDIQAILISSEHFHSRLVSVEEIRRLYKLLSPICDEFRIIVYLRRQDELARSLASTYFKTGLPGGMQELRDHLERLTKADHYFNYLKLLTMWAKVFGKKALVPRRYGKQYFYDGDLLKDFIEGTGILPGDAEYKRQNSHNVSLSPVALMTLDRFKKHFPETAAPVTETEAASEVQTFQQLHPRFVAALEKAMPGYPAVFSQGEAERFYDRFRKDNHKLARQWFGTEQLFNEEFSAYPTTAPKVQFDPVLIDTLLAFFRRELKRERAVQIATLDAD